MTVFVDGHFNVAGCQCGPTCEFPCWQRAGLTDQPCCPDCPPFDTQSDTDAPSAPITLDRSPIAVGEERCEVCGDRLNFAELARGGVPKCDGCLTEEQWEAVDG